MTVFSLGDTLAGAQGSALGLAGAWGALTHWYQGSSELSWQLGYSSVPWKVDTVYDNGQYIDLVVYLGGSATTEAYGGTSQFITDLTSLCQVFSRPKYPMMVTLFSEIETYTSESTYIAACLANVPAAVSACHGVNPLIQVGLGLGGYDWLDSSGDPQQTADLSTYTTAMAACDFVSTQLMFADNPATSWQNGLTASQYAIEQLAGMGTQPVHVQYSTIWTKEPSTGVADPPGNNAIAFCQWYDAIEPAVLSCVAHFGFKSEPVAVNPGGGFDRVVAATQWGTPLGRPLLAPVKPS